MSDIVFNVKYGHNTNLLNKYMPYKMAIFERVKDFQVLTMKIRQHHVVRVAKMYMNKCE